MVSQFGGSQIPGDVPGASSFATAKGTSKRFQRFASLFSRIPKISAQESVPDPLRDEDEDCLGVLMNPSQRDEVQRIGFLSFTAGYSPGNSGIGSPVSPVMRQQSQGLGSKQAGTGFAQALAARAKSLSSRQPAGVARNGSATAPVSANNSTYNYSGAFAGPVQLPSVNNSFHGGQANGISAYAGMPGGVPNSRQGSFSHAPRKHGFGTSSAGNSQHGLQGAAPAPLLIPVACLELTDDVYTLRTDSLPTPPSAQARSLASFRRASFIVDRSMESVCGTGSHDNLAGLERLPSGSVLNILSSPEVMQQEKVPSPKKHADSRLLAVSPTLPAAMQRPVYLLEDYTLTAKLHASNTCSVYKAFCKWSMSTVVLKVYETAKLTDLSRMQLAREVELHIHMDHPNILRLYGAWQEGQQVVLLQEYAEGGDLFDILSAAGKGGVVRMEESVAVKTVIGPLLRALHYLHSRGILHRDIKLENLLFRDAAQTQLMLADFGIAINLSEERGVTRADEYMSQALFEDARG